MTPKQLRQNEEPGDLHLAQTEIRHLRNTIAALRDELEGSRFARDEAVQKAVAQANDEINQLRATVAALRDELDRHRHEHQTEIQALRQAERDSTKQLQDTIATLREKLEARPKE